jgi:multicomponent Na+:H+ antiporter subunit E
MNRPVLFVLLLLFWVSLTWPADPPGLTYLQDVGTGVVVALLVTWIMGETATEGLARWFEPKRYLWALAYVFVLAAYIAKANVEVAYRVLHPAMPIRPGIVKVKTHLQRSSSRTALSNSITLTPGTLTVDIHDDGVMMVHWIYVQSVDEEEVARQVIGRFEWFIERIFE